MNINVNEKYCKPILTTYSGKDDANSNIKSFRCVIIVWVQNVKKIFKETRRCIVMVSGYILRTKITQKVAHILYINNSGIYKLTLLDYTSLSIDQTV